MKLVFTLRNVNKYIYSSNVSTSAGLCSRRPAIKDSYKVAKFRKPAKINNDFDIFKFKREFRYNTSELYQDTEWSDVYPVEKPYDHALIGLPIRAGGHKILTELPPEADGNAALWQIDNFFHLTPPAIIKHCNALKPLCTKWQEDMPYHPIKVTVNDYVMSGNDRYHPFSRKVKMEIDIDALELTERPREKFLELLGNKFDKDNNVFILESDRCPTRAQNENYLYYLLKVLYYEANNSERWEMIHKKGAGNIEAETKSIEAVAMNELQKGEEQNMNSEKEDKQMKGNMDGISGNEAQTKTENNQSKESIREFKMDNDEDEKPE